MKKTFESNIFVQSIPKSVSDAELLKAFGEVGEILSHRVIEKKSRMGPSNYKNAYILFDTVENAQAAIRKFDQENPFGGRPMKVQFWISKQDLKAEHEERNKREINQIVNPRSWMAMGRNSMPPQNGRGNFNQRGKGGRQQQQRPRPVPKQPIMDHMQQPIEQAMPNPVMPQPVAQKPMLRPLNVDPAQLNTMTDPNQRKQFVGNTIYPNIAEVYGENAGKITGMLLDESQVNFLQLLTDVQYLNTNVLEANRLLTTNVQKQ